MNAAFEPIDKAIDSSFLYRIFQLKQFDAPYHYHPEYELTYIVKSKGKRFIGKTVTDFDAGDMILLGPNVPHFWQNTEGVTEATAIVIHFKEDFVGPAFWDIPEMKRTSILLKKSLSGIHIQGEARDIIATKMEAMHSLDAFQKWLYLMEILNIIALSSDIDLIDKQGSNLKLSLGEAERIHKIYAFIIDNYTQDIDLNKAAQLIHMTPTAFCRYFKKMTRKTLIAVVTEFRVRHACQLLTTTEKPISDIAFESGFGNLSFFNKQFKLQMGFSPLRYRKLFM
jgi:AraC-like DNA-binding protein